MYHCLANYTLAVSENVLFGSSGALEAVVPGSALVAAGGGGDGDGVLMLLWSRWCC